MRISFVVFVFVTIYIQKSNSVDLKYLSAFNFGDSNSDTGDLVAGLGVHLDLPNGQNYFKISSQRFCDGRLVIDYLSKVFSVYCLLLINLQHVTFHINDSIYLYTNFTNYFLTIFITQHKLYFLFVNSKIVKSIVYIVFLKAKKKKQIITFGFNKMILS